MADQALIDTLKLMAPAGAHTDADLGTMIDDVGLESSAARLWEESATQTASLVNVSESGSSRSLGDIHKNALAMAKHYSDKAAQLLLSQNRRPRTRSIERP